MFLLFTNYGTLYHENQVTAGAQRKVPHAWLILYATLNVNSIKVSRLIMSTLTLNVGIFVKTLQQ